MAKKSSGGAAVGDAVHIEGTDYEVLALIGNKAILGNDAERVHVLASDLQELENTDTAVDQEVQEWTLKAQNNPRFFPEIPKRAAESRKMLSGKKGRVFYIPGRLMVPANDNERTTPRATSATTKGKKGA